MKALFEVIALALCALIISTKGNKRLAIYLCASFFITDIFGTAHTIFAISAIISLFIHHDLKRTLNIYPLRRISLAILLIYFLITFFNSAGLNISLVSKPMIYFCETYLKLFVGFALISKIDDWLSAMKVLLPVLTIFAIWGVFTWFMQSNPWYEFLTNVYGSEAMWSGVQDRGYRVNSFLTNPGAYGVVMGIGALSLWGYYLQVKNNKIILFILLIVFNVILANSRASLMACFVGLAVYLLFNYGVSRKLIFIATGGFLGMLILYNYVGSIKSIVDSTLDVIFTGGQNTHGSNMELKDTQLQYSILYFLEAPIWGHGIGFFREYIQPRYGTMSGLAGMEGYGYRMLVELGGVMIVAFVAFVIRFLNVLCGLRKVHRNIFSITIAQFICFYFYIIAAGDYGNIFEYSFILIGMNLRYLLFNQRNIRIQSYIK